MTRTIPGALPPRAADRRTAREIHAFAAAFLSFFVLAGGGASAGERAAEKLPFDDFGKRDRLAFFLNKNVEIVIPFPALLADDESPPALARATKLGKRLQSAELSSLLHLAIDERRHRRVISPLAEGMLVRVRGKIGSFPGDRGRDGGLRDVYYLEAAGFEPVFDLAVLSSPVKEDEVEVLAANDIFARWDPAAAEVAADDVAFRRRNSPYRTLRFTTRFPGLTKVPNEAFALALGLEPGDESWKVLAVNSPFLPAGTIVLVPAAKAAELEKPIPWQSAVTLTGRQASADGLKGGAAFLFFVTGVAVDAKRAWLTEAGAVKAASADYEAVDPARQGVGELAGRRVVFPFPWRGWLEDEPSRRFLRRVQRVLPAKDGSRRYLAAENTDWSATSFLGAARVEPFWRAGLNAVQPGDTVLLYAQVEAFGEGDYLVVVENAVPAPRSEAAP